MKVIVDLILSVSVKRINSATRMILNTKQLNTKQMNLYQRQPRKSASVIVPGTTISITLMPTYIEVRDKGVIKKKIPLKSRSFEDISLELQKYLRYLGKRLAPGVLEDILERIGLPKARRVIPEPEIVPEPEVEPEPKAEPTIEIKPKAEEKTAEVEPVKEIQEPMPITEEPPKEKPFLKRKEKKKEVKEPAATFVQSGMSGDEKGVISADDFDDISDALQAVEALSDSFMAPSINDTQKEEKKAPPKISIKLEGQEEIKASESTYARAPDIEATPESTEDDIQELVAVTVDEDGKEITEEQEQRTPTHQIKPVITCKALLLGETGVGKRTLIQKGGFSPVIINEESNEVSKYIFGNMVDALNHRVDMRIWSFDLAVHEKLPRKDYYNDADLLFIAYSASDRWSFESIDFWLRETSISCEVTPPIIIIANKIDLRLDAMDDSGEEPVSYNEGFQYAEELAKKLGTDKKLHPVAFIETSAQTGEKVEDVFGTAAELYENSLKD